MQLKIQKINVALGWVKGVFEQLELEDLKELGERDGEEGRKKARGVFILTCAAYDVRSFSLIFDEPLVANKSILYGN